MAEENPTALAERIFAIFSNRVVEWLGEQGTLTLALACVLVPAWIAYQKCRERPEFEFIIDLTVDVALAYVFSEFIRVFAKQIVKLSHDPHGFANSWLGQQVIVVMEALHYLPLVIIFGYQVLRLCLNLRDKLKDR